MTRRLAAPRALDRWMRMAAGLLLAGSFATDVDAQAQPGEVTEPAPRVSVSFEATPLDRVVATFAEFSDRSIVLGVGVEGVVTAIIDDRPWDEALRAILESQGFRFTELENGIILVESLLTMTERAAYEAVTTRVFTLRYQLAGELEPAIRSMLSPRGQVAIAERANALVVTDVDEVLRRIEELLWPT